jgi:hypothetical protein
VAGTAPPLWQDARAIVPILGAAYTQEPMQVARAAPAVDTRAHNDACVPLTRWVCDGLAELDAIAVLLGCTKLGELDAAVASALDEWQTHGGGDVPRVPRLTPAIDAVLGELSALCRAGASGDAALAVVAPIVALIDMMRMVGADGAAVEFAPSPLGAAAGSVRTALHDYREELCELGAAIDRAIGEGGDRIAVALGIAARMHQVAVIAAAIAAWIDRRGPATAAQVRWRAAPVAIERVFAGSLAGVRRLVPLPP